MADKINIAKLNAKFREAQVKFDESLAAKPAKDLHPETQAALTGVAANFAGIPGTEGIDAALLTFCAAWPKVRPVINLGLKYASWIPGWGSRIALAKAWLETFNSELIPFICKPQD